MPESGEPFSPHTRRPRGTGETGTGETPTSLLQRRGELSNKVSFSGFDDVQDAWRIGYAPADWDALTKQSAAS